MSRLAGSEFTRRRELVVGSPAFRLMGPDTEQARQILGDLHMPLVNLDGLTRAIYGQGLPRPDIPGVLDLEVTGSLLIAYARLLAERGLGRVVALPVRLNADEQLRMPRHRLGLMVSLWTPGAQVARADLVAASDG